jgi:hypothetical protein
VTEELEREYAMRFVQTARYRSGVWRVLIQEFFSRWIPENSIILDLGCGWGNSSTKSLLNGNMEWT